MKEWIIDILAYKENEPLLFTQLYFWIFLGIVLVGFSFLYKSNILRNTYLFIVSLFFYYKSGGYFFSLLIFSTIVDYTAGKLIYYSQKKSVKKLWLTLSVVVNLLVLGYFKYTYFIIDVINQLFHTNFEVTNLLAAVTNQWFGTSFDISEIILPVGISFYTFQTMSYTIDVYRNKIKPVNNIVDFAFYVSFFPQLVAGPIVRASEFIPQLFIKYHLTKQEFSHALFLILNGLIKKMVISDYLSINFVDRIFENPSAYSGIENLLGVYGYAIQIYCDFSGYTDIATGVALLFGFRLPINFNSPYKATNITDFWRRWHISLSTWLRDYLYIPLGGNRKGKLRQYLNLMITMLLGGLWHGANIKFIIWGGIHGIALMTHKLFQSLRIRIPSHKIGNFISICITFHIVCFAWLFFRAPDINSVNTMLQNIIFYFHANIFIDFVSSYPTIVIILLLGFIIHWLPCKIKETYRGMFIRSPYVVKLLITFIAIFIIVQIKSSTIQPFIYFQF
ncbi:MAG: MBOAT family protein [Bacteroidales bacterium]|nr:MBOAT family protein [Bacteroidales bacterium]